LFSALYPALASDDRLSDAFDTDGQRCYQPGPPRDCDDVFGSILVSKNL
jgi:hypothetical protein